MSALAIPPSTDLALPWTLELNPHERLVEVMRPWWFAWLPFYVLPLGLCAFWRRKNYTVVTTHRVWIGHGIVLFKKGQSLPLDKIQDATYERRFWIGNILISSAGGPLGALRQRGFRPARAKDFVVTLNTTRDSVHPTLSGSATLDDDLRRIASLRDEGLLTAQEFESKKADILRRM